MMKQALTFSAVVLLSASLQAEEETSIDFFRDIQPIFQNNCYKCHGPDKEKGDLRLHLSEIALAAGEDGNVIIPGKPDESLLLTLITLPADDVDIMPSEGDPLTKEQTDLIRKWIAEGAIWPDTPPEGFGKTGIDFEKDIQPILDALSKEQQETLRQWVEQGAEWPKEPEAPKPTITVQPVPIKDFLASIEGKEFSGTIRQVAQNADFVEVDFRFRDTDEISASDLQFLNTMGKNMIYLNLSGAEIADSHLANFKDLPQLTHLHLEKTKVEGPGLANLKSSVNLTYLNLFGTPLTDAGLTHLKDFQYLRKLYLWNTNVTDEAVKQLQAALPFCDINRGWDGPVVIAAEKEEEEKKTEEEKEKPAAVEKKEKPAEEPTITSLLLDVFS